MSTARRTPRMADYRDMGELELARHLSQYEERRSRGEAARLLESARSLTPELIRQALRWPSEAALSRFLYALERSPLFTPRTRIGTDAHRSALLDGALDVYARHPDLVGGADRLSGAIRAARGLPLDSEPVQRLQAAAIDWARLGNNPMPYRTMLETRPDLPAPYLEILAGAAARHGVDTGWIISLLAHPNATKPMVLDALGRRALGLGARNDTFICIPPALMRDSDLWHRLMPLIPEGTGLVARLAETAPDVGALESLSRAVQGLGLPDATVYRWYISAALTNPHFGALSPETRSLMLSHADGADRLRIIASLAEQPARKPMGGRR